METYFRIALFRRRIALLQPGSSVTGLVDLTLRCKEIQPIQLRSELTQFMEMVNQRKPRTILEIGTAQGGTLFLFCQLADENATVISVDLPGGEFGGGYPEWKTPIYRAFARKTQTIHLLRMDSHLDSTLEDVRANLAGREVDLLFIDGDHTYEGVKRDFELYSPLVARGGLIAFHDVAPCPPSPDYGVRRFWEALKAQHECKEIIEDQTQHGYGIGLLQE